MTNAIYYFLNATKRFASDEKGNDAVEYGLILGLIALGITVAATSLGTEVSGLFTRASGRLAAIAP